MNLRSETLLSSESAAEPAAEPVSLVAGPDSQASNDAATFTGDTGAIPVDTRRVIVQLLLGPSLDARRQTKLWPVLLRDETVIRSRLHELFLELVIDHDQQVAFTRQVVSEQLDVPILLRKAALTFLESALILFLRQRLTQADAQGERAVVALTETYSTAQGRTVVLAQILWVKGNSAASTDAKRLYLVLEREFDVSELEFFAKAEFDVRRLKHELDDATVHTEFSAYQERFRRLLGIENERALRLLHKTQSAKNLGDLNVFLRDFMLDAPETFEVADSLVNEFGELNAAHQAVVAARDQVNALKPARDDHQAYEKAGRHRNGLQAIQTAVDPYREHLRKHLLEERIAELKVDRDGAAQDALRLDGVVNIEFEKLTELQQKKLGMGADVLDHLQKELADAEADKPARLHKRELAEAACKAMGWAVPDTLVWFVQRVAAARQRVQKASEFSENSERHKDGLKEALRKATDEFNSTVAEVRSLERQRTNLPAKLVEIRDAIAAAVGIAEEKLPFVGELLEVKSDAAPWQGAIERVLGGFARSILVEDKNYAAVSAYLNDHNIGERLAYFRVMSQVSGNRSPGPNSLVRKLNVAPGPYADWLREDLKTHFDLECAETMVAFRAASKAVTREGQVKHNFTHHEKNDRQRIDDRSRWVLGFDNKAKLALYKERAADLGGQISELDAQLTKAKEADNLQRTQLLHCQDLSNLTWADVDVASLLTQIDDFKRRIEQEKADRPELAEMDRRIQAQDRRHRDALKSKNDAEIKCGSFRQYIAKFEGQLFAQERTYPTAGNPPQFREELDAKFAEAKREIDLDTLDQATVHVVKGISNDLRAIETEIAGLRNSIVQKFAEFNRRWPAESGGLDPTMESADDYFAKLQRIETDGLPGFEERFKALLRKQSDENLTLLSSKLKQERTDIKARMELVNESLCGAPFNKDTHLVIETTDRNLEEVRQFHLSLKGALSHSFSPDADLAAAELRFAALAALVKRLASQETVDKNWRALVLDVRQHVEFVARELDQDNVEVEVYRSGAGKSGGQRQKLAATCLAAALRYQLGGQDRALPSFSTVVLDEAFDKADAEFTAMAMNIFKTFGFQMIVATPMKSVMTLEPFIGGACYVHIKERKKSAVLQIEYDVDTQRLKLTPDVRHVEEVALA